MAKSLTQLQAGEQLGTTEWIEIGQKKINDFADATGDQQWIHVDQNRCKAQSPFGTTIAHGLLSTSLMPNVFYQLISLDPTKQTLLNYGMDTLRFLEPVRVNDSIRYHVSVDSIQQKSTGTLYRFECSVEIKNRDKPAMVAKFLMLLVG